MASRHLTPSLVAAIRRGDVPPEQERAVRSHVACCATCRKMVEGIWDKTGIVGQASESTLSRTNRRLISREAYSQVLDRVFNAITEENDKLEDQRVTASELLLDLLDLELSQQRLLIRNSPRYQVWPLAEQFLEQCRRGWAEDPSRSEALAGLALEISDQLTAQGFRDRLLSDLRAEAWSYIGNCHRIRSDFHGAENAFRRAEDYLAEGSGDPMERARLLDLKSSLLRAQRDFNAASTMLAEAIRRYRGASERHLEGRALLKQAKFLRDSGRLAESIPALERAATLLDANREPRTLLALKNNLAMFLAEMGRVEEAQRCLPEVRELSRQHGSRHDRLRVLWVEGILCKSLGQTELALEIMKQVREGFIAAEIGYDVALVSLDLAALYLEAGRTDEVRCLASEGMHLFVSRGVHREVLMAWTLFREAAERDAATLGLVQEVATRIRHAQVNPGSGDIP